MQQKAVQPAQCNKIHQLEQWFFWSLLRATRCNNYSHSLHLQSLPTSADFPYFVRKFVQNTQLSGHVQINTEFWKTNTRNAKKQWTPTSMQRPIHLHRIPALFYLGCIRTHSPSSSAAQRSAAQRSAAQRSAAQRSAALSATMNARHLGQVVALLACIQCMHTSPPIKI